MLPRVTVIVAKRQCSKSATPLAAHEKALNVAKLRIFRNRWGNEAECLTYYNLILEEVSNAGIKDCHSALWICTGTSVAGRQEIDVTSRRWPYSSTSSMLKRGRSFTSMYILPMYSPTSPMLTSTQPEQNQMESISDDHPGTVSRLIHR